jgi:hypothetical protein
LGGGRHGHLEIIMKAGEYYIMSNTPFDVSVDPYPLPVIFPDMDNELRHIHTESNNVDVALNCQIISQYDDIYLEAVEYYMVGVVNVSALDLLLQLGAT